MALLALPAQAADGAMSSAAVETAPRHVWLTFGLDRIPGLGMEIMGNPLWQYLAFLVYVLLAFYVSKLLDYLIQVQLRKWAAKTETWDPLESTCRHASLSIL